MPVCYEADLRFFQGAGVVSSQIGEHEPNHSTADQPLIKEGHPFAPREIQHVQEQSAWKASSDTTKAAACQENDRCQKQQLHGE